MTLYSLIEPIRQLIYVSAMQTYPFIKPNCPIHQRLCHTFKSASAGFHRGWFNLQLPPGFESWPWHVRKLPVTWGLGGGFFGFLHQLQLSSHDSGLVSLYPTRRNRPISTIFNRIYLYHTKTNANTGTSFPSAFVLYIFKALIRALMHLVCLAKKK